MKNFLGYLWYGSSANEAPASGRSIGTVSTVINDGIDTIDSLSLKRNQFLAKAKDAEIKAREANKTDKKRALLFLRQKQQYENQAAVYSGMISNMEQTTQSLDTAAVSIQVAKTMQAASQQIKAQMGEVKVEDIDAVADDLDDSMRDVNEMASALSRPMLGMGGGGEMDDDELLAQLDAADAAEVELPSAPTGKVELKYKTRFQVETNE